VRTAADIGLDRVEVTHRRGGHWWGAPMFAAILAIWGWSESGGDPRTTALILALGLALLGFLFWITRTRRVLVIDSAGLTDPRSGSRVAWGEIATIELRESLVGFQVQHRLVVGTEPQSPFSERAQRRRAGYFEKQDAGFELRLDYVEPGRDEILEILNSRSGRTIPTIRVKTDGMLSPGVLSGQYVVLGSLNLMLSISALVAKQALLALLALAITSYFLFLGMAVKRRQKRFEAGQFDG
jgi:hypothetical protein